MESHAFVRLAVIESSELLRTGLRVALHGKARFEFVGEFGLDEEAVSGVERLKPDVVLLGMRRNHLEESAAICRLVLRASRLTKVLIISLGAWEDEALTAILSGASGYLSVDASPEELVQAVRVVVTGGSHFDERVAERLIHRLQHDYASEIEDEHLSEREQMILYLLAQGLKNREIAEGLGIATATVRNNLTKIRDKLGLDSRTKLVRFVLEGGVPARSTLHPASDQSML